MKRCMSAIDIRLFEYAAVWIASLFLCATNLSLSLPSLTPFQNYAAVVLLAALACSLALVAYDLARSYLARRLTALFASKHAH